MPSAKPERIYLEVGRRIAQARKELGWTQEGLAELVGRDASYIARIETAQRRATIDTLHRVAEAMGLELRELFPSAIQPNPGHPGIAALLGGLSDEDLVLVAAVARRLARK